MMNPVPYEAVEPLLDLLEKGAAALDGLELENQKLRSENTELRRQPKQAAAPFFSSKLIEKVASQLEAEGLLSEGITAKQAAASLMADPNRLAEIVLNLTAPVQVEGRPTKVAHTTLPGNPDVVQYNGQPVVDKDGWLQAVK